MVNTNLLKSYIIQNNLTQEELAKKLSISQQSLSNKINNKFSFKINEVLLIIDLLKIENTDNLFSKIFLN